MQEGLKGGPTQDEVLAISLQKLGLRSGDRFADVGCGTGKVSIAASKEVDSVLAIDLRPEAFAYAQREIAKSGRENIKLVEGNAVDVLRSEDRVDAAFVGGSKHLDEVLSILVEKGARSIVVNAVLVSTLHQAVKKMKELGIFQEAVMVQVSRSRELVGDIMFKPLDPVFVIVGGRTC